MRQYVSSVALNNDGTLESAPDDFRHLHNVLRLKVGDNVNVRLPNGSLCAMTVCRTDTKRKVLLFQKCGGNVKNIASKIDVAENFTDAENVTADNTFLGSTVEGSAPLFEFWLFMFVAKTQKMELVIRQATECGVSKIVPVVGAYSQTANVTSFKSKASGERFSKIVREAQKQSGSALATEILPIVDVTAAAKMWESVCGGGHSDANSDNSKYGKSLLPAPTQCMQQPNIAVVLYERNEHTVPLHEIFELRAAHTAYDARTTQEARDVQTAQTGSVAQNRQASCAAQNGTIKIAIAVGCEGGISPNELEILRGAGFVPVHFATNILRCETAAIYGIAAVQTAVTERNLWCLKK